MAGNHLGGVKETQERPFSKCCMVISVWGSGHGGRKSGRGAQSSLLLIMKDAERACRRWDLGFTGMDLFLTNDPTRYT